MMRCRLCRWNKWAVFSLLLAPLAHPAFAGTTTVDRIAATVNDEVITLSDLQDAQGAHGRRPAGEDQRKKALDELIDDLLFQQALKEAKIEVSDEDVARAVNNVLAQNRITLNQLVAELSSKGISYNHYKKQLEREIRKVKFINQVIGPQVKISDQDLRDYYQKQQERFRGSHRMHIAEVVIPLGDVASQEEFDRRYQEAQAIAKQKKRGNELVDRGMVDVKQLDPLVANAVRRLRPGEVSSPIVTPQSIVIVKLIALPELSGKDFEKLRDEIYNALYDERVTQELGNYLLQQRRKSYIDIR